MCCSRVGVLAGWSLLAALLTSCSFDTSGRPAGESSPHVAAPKVAETSDDKPIEALTASSLPSVVVVTHYGRDGTEDGVGAGFIISPDGLVATSLHVIGEGRRIGVRMADGQRREVLEVHASDRNLDLAILRIRGERLPSLKLGNSATLKQGASVLALGNPLGLEHSVVQGVVSARRDVDGVEMIQVAIPIEPGNSGGPLLDRHGRVQGVVTLKSAVTANLGFAIPVNQLQMLVDRPNPVPMERWLTLGTLSARRWTPLFGANWTQRAGRIHVEGAGKGFGGRSLCLSQLGVPAVPFEISASVKLDDESGAAGLIFGSDGGDRHYGFYPSAGQLRLTRFDGPDVFTWTILKQIATDHYHPGNWNHLRVRIEPKSIRCFVNGHLIAEADETVPPTGQLGLGKFRDTKAEFRSFQVATNPPPQSTKAAEKIISSLPDQNTSPITSELRSTLRKEGPATYRALEEHASKLEEKAAWLRTLASTLHEQAVQDEMLKVLSLPDDRIDLFRAALLVARLDDRELDSTACEEDFEAMARELKSRISSDTDDTTKLDVLTKYLFAENGFHGSRSDYYHRANSYIHQVLEDREGLPITLSVLFLELGHRLGVQGLSGLPLPGHFMVLFAPQEGSERIIDVFSAGKTLSRSEAQERVFAATGEGFRESEFRSATKKEIVIRMLRNLLGLAQRNNATADQLRYLNCILALSPDSASDRLSRARLRLQARDKEGAREDFKWMLDYQPAGFDLERIGEIYRSL